MTDERRRDEGVGDAAVDAAWRHAAREQPPVRVDDAILAAARAAVRRDAPPAEPAPAPRPRARWQPLAAAAGVIGLSLLLVQWLPRDEPARGPAAPAAGDAATAAPAERAAEAVAAPPTTLEARAGQAAARDPAPPADWVRRIAAFHDAGDLVAATAELRAFRAAHPDAEQYLPESLRAWAASVVDEGVP